MGMTVLYVAFGFVALWLLAEVLMQYKARLRWRLLAFAGFLGVVGGVVLPSVPVIAAGALAFALGQTLVTLSFRKGFEAGWALRKGGKSGKGGKGGKGGDDAAAPKGARRRRAGGPRSEPVLEVSGVEYGAEAPGGPSDAGADGAAESGKAPRPRFTAATEDLYSPEPLPEDTGSYGIQSFASGSDAGQTAAFASPFTTAEQDAHGYTGYQDPQAPGGGYDYPGAYQPDGGQQVYAAYSDPYIGTGGGVIPQQPYDYTPYGGQGAGPYTGGTTGQDQYAMDTPPGGVWVPQQRDVAQPYPADGQAYPQQPQQQPQQYPYQGSGDYEQYRY
ncbi:hypothetical protein HYE82_20915 [Streptomyces sp. BR123]|uniref:hypothetical protein n=1 Tax=Streptomyces sp. BR123 TaxID=2749828 RepID=UPI0015C4C474|nr:hypothetical protein [Streptomyces sp. BR123]NXY96801.1 hypothetical protein [Streptomyces sp. BR123]